MPIGYRSILSVAPSADLIDRVDVIVAAWLKSKDLPRLSVAGIERLADGRQLSRVDVDEQAFRGRRWELKETWGAPRFGTQLGGGVAVTVVSVITTAEAAWLWIDIDAPGIVRIGTDGVEQEESQFTGTPRVIADLIAELAPFDGRAEPYSGAMAVTAPAHVKELVDVVTDAARIGAVFVSAPPAAISTEAWTSTIEEIVRGTDGMAVTYVLSPEAHRAFSGLVGASHSFGAGSLRTYLPGAIPGDAGDSFRHRVLGYATIRASHPRRLGHVLRSAQIDRLETLRLPTLLRSVDYALLRASRRQPLVDLGALRERSSRAEGNADALTQVNAELTAALETERGDMVAFLEQYYELEQRVRDARETTDILQLELNEAEDEAERSTDLASALRARLRKVEAFAEADAPISPDEEIIYPDSFAELLEQLSTFEHLRYVGRRAQPLALDEQPNIRPAVHKAWAALATLNDYARLSLAGEFAGNVTHYIEDGSHSGFNRMLNFKPNEGDGVQQDPRLAVQREVEIPGQGMVMMTAHVGLLNRRAGAPRLYFLDRVADEKVVYVGYIGRHLVNAKLN